MIQESVAKLVQYGLTTGLIEKEDAIYTANRLLGLLNMDTLEEETEAAIMDTAADEAIIGRLEKILGDICDYAYDKGIIEENTVGYRDLFDTKVMSLLVDRPSNIIHKFEMLYQESPKKATDFSFPSGHSASAFAAAAAICKTQKGSKWRWIVLIGAVCMALSRLYIGIHYPSDVICGALSGTLCGLAAAFLTDAAVKHFRKV